MYIFINRMRPHAETTQFMFSLENDGENSIFVYNAFLHWDQRQKHYFVVRREDAGLLLSGCELWDFQSTPSVHGVQSKRREQYQAALDMFFEESMVDTNRWPREGCEHKTMEKMTFMVIYEARDFDPLSFLAK